ncbi:MAG: cytochrome C peroxidase [Desulfatitalea sp. BRH_c12]|nr:MAG: cytochrome C peroxidase [Desulfatitalea sp. BRH_c12]
MSMVVTTAAAGPLTPIQQLGKIMYQDLDFSYNSTQSCLSCHHHRSGFADPANSLDPEASVVSVGADGVSLGGRNAPSSAYAGFSPTLHWDNAHGGYMGGMFWDGRATGKILGDPLAEQAQGPPLNPVEMKMPDMAAVVQAVRDATYANLFRQVFGTDALEDVPSAYDNIGRAIAAYERSGEVQKFSSPFDRGQLTARQQSGAVLFEAHCAQCHSMADTPPLFTNYSYVNIGLPTNELLTGNPDDLGLGGFLEADFTSNAPLFADADYAAQYGKFKVPTLRNVAMSAPYGHNGVFPTLTMMVAFHNTRDTGGWPEPEVANNLNDDVGDMGLTDTQVDDLVAFLLTLSDDLRMGP